MALRWVVSGGAAVCAWFVRGLAEGRIFALRGVALVRRCFCDVVAFAWALGEEGHLGRACFMSESSLIARMIDESIVSPEACIP